MLVVRLSSIDFKPLIELYNRYAKNSLYFRFLELPHFDNHYFRKFTIGIQIILVVILFILFPKRVIFGSFLCKYLSYLDFILPFGKTVFIFNEVNERFLKIDKIQSRVYRRSLLVVSNKERAMFLQGRWGLDSEPILMPNYPSTLGKDVIKSNDLFGERQGLIYTGQVTSTRFDTQSLTLIENHLSTFSGNVEFYGYDTEDIAKRTHFISYGGTASPSELMLELPKKKFGLLSYVPSDANNDLCAPIKVFEYLEMGLIPVSTHKNKSFINLNEKYPHLIFFLEDFEPNQRVLARHHSSKKQYLSEINRQNEEFCKNALKYLNGYVEN